MQALILLVLLLTLLSGCGTPRSKAQTSPLPNPDGWAELAPGIRYKMGEGRVSLEYDPPLFTAQGVARFEGFAQEQMGKATTEEERRFWEEEVAFVKGQYAIWSDEDLVVNALELAFLGQFPLPLDKANRQALRAKLEEIVRLMKQGVDPQSLPEPELPPQLRTPDGGMVVGPDTFPILIQSLTPQFLFPSCSLAASAMPTTASPGAKAYAIARCSDTVVWGSTESRTAARAGNDWDFCQNSGWPFSQCMSVAYGSTGCSSGAWAGYYYHWQDFRLYSGSRSASNSRCQ
ncbi:hypothetical protein [Thermus caldifontis]|uniref:hypothetical protein n=1 Tax=Thermus caldifontis TaxID=1930763 RepID=UPI000DF21DFF|nr:hypothetical protein [Thermus caldifontis]